MLGFPLTQMIIKQSKEKIEALIENSYDVIGMIDKNGIVTFVGPRVKKVLGYEVEDIIGTYVYNYIHPTQKAIVRKILNSFIKNKKNLLKFETVLQHQNGQCRYVEVILNNHLDKENIGAITFNYQDITERKLFNEKIRQMEYYDELTGLPNGKFFKAKLTKVLSKAEESKDLIAVMFLDLDDFKNVNDVFGYEFGDRLITAFSDRLIRQISKMFISRFGGDKFAFILRTKDIKDINKTAEQISTILEFPFIIDGFELFLSASIGISIYPNTGKDVNTLIKNTDIALCKAKEDGKNNYTFYSYCTNKDEFRNFKLKNDLNKALLDEQFLVYYQAKVNPKNNTIVGAEALIRWNHPEYNLVSPAEFIPLAEETGLIIKIGEWVLERVALQIEKWREVGLKLKLSINISVIQLLQPNFIDMITKILVEHQIKPQEIELEITEGVIIQNEGKISKILLKLDELGFSIALDDFGTGYSAINYLKKYKIKTLKIDKSIIQQIDNDPDSFEITNAIINLAQKLNISIVAEGVETNKQFSLLKEMECDQLQGFLFSRPVSVFEFEKLFKDQRSILGNLGI